jgi:acyl-CoA oxidase
MSSAVLRRCAIALTRPAYGQIRLSSTALSASAISALSIDKWAAAFKQAAVDVAKMDIKNVTYDESAERLRTLLKTGLLRHTDLVDKPERFFLAHKLLAEHSPQLGPGFWIRFTVHYNLCVGTILGLGNDSQIKDLEEMQSLGQLGCFSLTEKFAGVNSGMIVQTTAEWDNNTKTFVLNSPDIGSQKNWISQGLVADKTVVVADLRIDGKSHGPHGFVMDLRVDGKVVEGVSHGDMGQKTVGNDLDNAWICFQNVRLPKSALLNRYALLSPIP